MKDGLSVSPAAGALPFEAAAAGGALATIEISLAAGPGSALLAAFKVKLLAPPRFAVAGRSVGWLARGETARVRVRALGAGDEGQGQLVRVEVLALRDAEELRAFSASAEARSGGSGSAVLATAAAVAEKCETAAAVAEKCEAAALWKFLPAPRIAAVSLSAALPVQRAQVAAGAATPARFGTSSRGPAAASFNSPSSSASTPASSTTSASPPLHGWRPGGGVARGHGLIPSGNGLGWRKGPIIGRGAFGLVYVGVITYNASGGAEIDGSVGTGGALVDAVGAGAAKPLAVAALTGLRVGTPVALKEVPLQTPQAWPSACREAAAMAACSGHPNVPRLFALRRMAPSLASPLERALLIMEYVPGGTLAQLATAWAAKNRLVGPAFVAQQGEGGDHGGGPRARAGPASDADAATSNYDFSSAGSSQDREAARGLPEAVVRTYIRELLHALAHVHARGLAHRDVKGANLLLSSQGRVLLTDFGSCKLSWEVDKDQAAAVPPPPPSLPGHSALSGPLDPASDSKGGEPPALPASQQRSAREQGTLQWMAPEVVTGGLNLGQSSPSPSYSLPPSSSAPTADSLEIDSLGWWQRADVWSVGCTALELLTARPPWFGIANDSAEVMLHMASTELRDRLPAWLSPEARFFVRACLNPNAAARPTPASLLALPFVAPTLLQGQGSEEAAALARLVPLCTIACRAASSWASRRGPTAAGTAARLLTRCICTVQSADSMQLERLAAAYTEAAVLSDEAAVAVAEQLARLSGQGAGAAGPGLGAADAASMRLRLPHAACSYGFVFGQWGSAPLLPPLVPPHTVSQYLARAQALPSEGQAQRAAGVDYASASAATDDSWAGEAETEDPVAAGSGAELEGLFMVAASAALGTLGEEDAPPLELLLLQLLQRRVTAWLPPPPAPSLLEARGLFGDGLGAAVEAAVALPASLASSAAAAAVARTLTPAGPALALAWHAAATARLQLRHQMQAQTQEAMQQAAQLAAASYSSPEDASVVGGRGGRLPAAQNQLGGGSGDGDAKGGDDDDSAWFVGAPSPDSAPGAASALAANWAAAASAAAAAAAAAADVGPGPLFDPAFAVPLFARLHCWALELRGCLGIVLALRARHRQAGRLSSVFARLERRVYARWVWLRRAWRCACDSAGLASVASVLEGGGGKEEDDEEVEEEEGDEGEGGRE